MSTKIYEAYRFKKGRLNEFMGLIDSELIPQIKDYAYEIYKGIKDEAIEKRREERNYDDDFSDEFIREELFDNLIRDACDSVERDLFDLTASFNFWIRGEYVYTIPYFESWLGEIDYPDWVEDYAYWNNSDRPEYISNEEWNKRRELWEEINSNWDKGRLVHLIMTSDGDRWFELKTSIRKRVMLGEE